MTKDIPGTMRDTWKSLAAVCAVVIGVYAYTFPLGRLESLISNPADAYYNLLVQGFRDGHLSLKKEVPTGFARLADPYDPDANRLYRGMPYGMSDMSYYKGRLYLYFGVTPALILFWPYVALTGRYLFHRQAVLIFCTVGFLASVGLLRAVWRRYFSEVNVGVVAACALALGLATGVPALLPQSDVYQVASSCGYMLTMLALGAIWRAFHGPEEKKCRWLAGASVAYGLAVGARPPLLFGAVILLVPVIQAGPGGWPRKFSGLLAAAIPITLIGLGLMLYNALRFDNPFEFGQHYQLGAERSDMFNLRYLWFNCLVNFLEPARWSGRFPFVHAAAVPRLPAGYPYVQDPFGVLTNIPVVWLALAAPLAWRKRSDQVRTTLRFFVMALWLLFGMCALTVGLFWSASYRYEVDFLPSLVLLAVIGILGFERVLATPGGTWLADRPAWRRLVRCGWTALLGFSVAFNVLVSVKNYAAAGCSVGRMLAYKNRVPEAIRVFEKALRIEPDYAEGHQDLGNALWQVGKRQEAMQEYEYALRFNPDYADAYVTLGTALIKLGRPEDAIRQYEEALRIYSSRSYRLIKYGCVATHVSLGNVLWTQGKPDDAIRHYEEALQIDSNSAPAHVNLGNALLSQGNAQDATAQYEAALRINPDDAETHYNLGAALVKLGRPDDAIRHCEEALRLKPNDPEAHYNFGLALAQAGRAQEAIEQWEQVLRLKPDEIDAHYNLGLALAKMNRSTEAIEHYQQALKIRPDFIPASNALQRLKAGQ